MIQNNKKTKSLIKLVAGCLTLGSVLGFSAVPAMAVENTETWTLEVEVRDTPQSDPCADFQSVVEPASWSPDTQVVYGDADGNVSDLASDDGLVNFSVDLSFSEGSETVCNQDPLTLTPAGSLVSSFEPISNDISATTDCDNGCDASGNFENENSIVGGTINVASSRTVETRSGTLTVTWTPAD